jgi:hypothetical protein
VAVVVIRSNGKADRAVESLQVKALGGQASLGQIRLGEGSPVRASTLLDCGGRRVTGGPTAIT